MPAGWAGRVDLAGDAVVPVTGDDRWVMVKPEARSPGLVGLGVLTAVSVPLATLPSFSEKVSAVTYFVSFCLCQVLTVAAVRRIPAAQRGPWSLMLVTASMWMLGEIWALVATWRQSDAYPTPADIGYVVGYAVLALAVLRLDRRDATTLRAGPLLDAAIVTLSVATLTVVFVIRPMVTDASESLLVRTVSSLYPLIDVLLVYLVARLLGSGRTRSRSLIWLAAAMLCTFVADTVMNVQAVAGHYFHYPPLLNLLWLLFYLFMGFAALEAGRPRQASRPVRCDRGDGDLNVPRLVVLAVAAMLPSLVVVSYGWWTQADLITSAQLGAGSAVLIALVAARIWGLITQLQAQARQLDRLAALDPLTGVANRRTWDAELPRFMAPEVRAGEETVLVALLDLDHFKRFNDTRGHQAGDELLRAAAAAWRDALGEDGLLARWGGEEFAVVLRAEDENSGLKRLDGLRAVVPQQQTVSIGVARWDGQMPADELIRVVDQALYEAKAHGRNLMCRAERDQLRAA
ncbi:GGDEF domain-containing protein [Kineosporia sp. J2-2]|uniref:GGDEF domain-containing protein n=1 Tax=Kineosporia corallincola TaxID=2835133 RepID=A0ABS5TBA8_9ACTN|nr:GGDEF domain-containing protein [Kineosporia corallincola]MBT0768321.1 GGDEF domain-containing protein [Kineosporia corallincola]